MPFDLYVWQSPRDVDDERAASLVRAWEAEGEDPATAPFKEVTAILNPRVIRFGVKFSF